jgi:two-component system cell cycle sensor histidine kinase/response regulator CckA
MEELGTGIPGVAWKADASTSDFTFVQGDTEALLGYSQEAWLAPGFWRDHLHPDDRERALAFRAGLVTTKSSGREDYRLLAADGQARWIRDSACAAVDADGRGLLRGFLIEITDLKRAELGAVARRSGDAAGPAHVKFLENLNRVNQAIQGASDLEQMTKDVLDVVLETFDVERAWLIYPCDPEAPSWKVPFERTHPDYPGALSMGIEERMNVEGAEVIRAVLREKGPVAFGPGAPRPLPKPLEAFRVRAMMCSAIFPNVDRPYLFGLHQCSRDRVFTSEECRLFQEIGRRLAGGLTSLSVLRKLQESQRKLGQAQELANIGHWEFDLQANRAELAETTYQILGLTPGPELEDANECTRQWQEAIHPDEREAVRQATVRALERGERFSVEYRLVRPDGEIRFVHSSGEMTRDEAGQPRRVFGFVQDVTQRRRAEDELRASETRFRLFVDHATDAFFLHDEKGHVVDVNRHGCEALGFSREEMIGMSPLEYDAELDPAQMERMIREFEVGKLYTFDTIHRRKDGSTFPVEVRLRPFLEGGRQFAVALARDITERLRTERALVESHSLLNSIVEGTSDAVFVKDLEGRYVMINSAGARLLGKTRSEVIGKDDRALFSADTVQKVLEHDQIAMQLDHARTFEEVLTAAGQTRAYLATKGPLRDARGKVTGLIGISRDVSELKRLEEQLRQAQKMEAIGRLAGGVAHDFNNLLTAINGFSELVVSELSEEDPNRPYLLEVLKAGERASNLTRQLLAFSRQQILHPVVVDLNHLLRGVCRLLRPLIGEDIELDFVPEPTLGPVRVDPGQFEHAVVNLAVNARDAMPQGGRLLIETTNLELDEQDAARHEDTRAGRYVLVAVSDTGHGMDETVRGRIFEPFFTTKAPGKGTGLGLAMVYGFVRQSGGQIEVSSDPGRGTTFKIYLPIVSGVPIQSAAPTTVRLPTGNQETILLVEDERAVRSLSRLVLEAHGYVVLEASDGLSALEVAERHNDKIDLLVTDLVMPKLGGRDLAKLLSESRPNLKVLLTSGYTDQLAIESDELAIPVAFLQKPFGPIKLAAKVREVLDAPAESDHDV